MILVSGKALEEMEKMGWAGLGKKQEEELMQILEGAIKDE